MGMSSGSKSGGLQTEINVTPLIDVVLVLLIIFLVTMPIMMKMVTLEVPRKIDDNETIDTVAGNPITVKVNADMTLVVNDGDKDVASTLLELPTSLRPLLEKKLSENKVVFVDFDNVVAWRTVVETMDQVRSIATDNNHDEVKVALKVKDPNAPAQ